MLPLNLNPFSISGLLVGVSSFSFGTLVFFLGTNRRIARIWFFFSYTMAVWGIGIFFATTTPNYDHARLAWILINSLGIPWTPAAFYHFICAFLEIKNRQWIAFHYVLAGISAWVMTSSRNFHLVWVFNSMYFTRGNAVFALAIVWWVGLCSYSHFLMIREYKRMTSQKKEQIKYFLLACVVGYSGGSLSWLPTLGFKVYPWGNFTIFLYPFIMFYAILKHHLMDINIVLRKSLVYSVMTALLTTLYLLIATALTHLLSGSAGATGFWPSAVAVGIMTLVFNPLLNQVHAFVDRQVFGDWLREIGRGVAHEVKQPLNSISMPAQLTLMELEEVEKGKRSFESYLPTLRERLRMIQSKAFEVGNRVEALRSISDPHREQMEPVDLRQLLLAIVAGFKDALEKSKVEIHTDLPESLSWVKGNAKQLEVVFGNLIKNANEAIAYAEASSSNGRHIWVRGMDEGKWVTLSIKDSGPGIKPGDLRRLFEVYFTTKGSRGTGVGLYLSKKVVQDHEGTVDVRSESGKGTEFIVRLPKFVKASNVAA